MPKQVFDGLRVVEFGTGMASAITGLLFADNGAEVIKVEPPAGDWHRGNPAFPMWNRGKKSVVLDLETADGRKSAFALAAGADLVIETFAPGEAARVGLSYKHLESSNPAILLVSISGFGMLDRFEYLGMDEGVVTAKAGRSMNNGPLSGSHVGGRAIHVATPLSSCAAAFLAVQAAGAGLIARLRTGRGQHIETSLIDGMSAATMRLAFERDGDKIVPVNKRGGAANLVIRGIRNTFLTVECADGRFIQMCARQVQHFHNWLEALGLSHLLKEERFAGLPFVKSFEDADEVEALLRAGMKLKTMPEWIEIFSTEYDVGGDPFLLPDEFLDHPQMVMNGRVVTLDDPDRGPVKQVGPLVLFEKTPSRIETPAPSIGQHQNEQPALITPRTRGHGELPPPSDDAELVAAPPLAGKTIVELAYYLAAPLGATTLAEMGARVIKIEPLNGDPFRSSGLEFVHIVAGKESIAVDLKAKAGQEIYRRLVEKADVVLHNFRPGAPDRLKVDYQSTQAINPTVVYVYGASYGSKGPESHRPAFHSTPNALCGGGILQAGRGNVPVDDSYPDPIAGLVVGVAIVMGLYAKERFGIGQYIETTMLTSSGYAHSEMLTRFAGAPPMPELDQAQHGAHALYRLYRCADGGYIFLSALLPQAWTSLAAAVGRPDLIGDRRFRDDVSRRQNDDALIEILSGIFEQQSNDAWERQLYMASVPAGAVFASFEQFLAEEGFLDEAQHHAFGSYWKLNPRVRFSRGSTRVGAAAALGEHTRALLEETGYGAKEIDDLLASKVVRAL